MNAHGVVADAIKNAKALRLNTSAPRLAAAVLDSLKAAGYAVVKLPESAGADDDGQEYFGDFARVDHTAQGTEYPIVYLGSVPTTPEDARQEAAIILAAVDAAEAQP